MEDFYPEAVEEWLGTLPFTLWATWDLSQPERKRQAAEWFVSQVKLFEAWINDIT